MTVTCRANVEEILGPIDGNTFAAIQASGASLEDLTEAKALADCTSDITGQGEQAIPGPVKQVLTILTGKPGSARHHRNCRCTVSIRSLSENGFGR